MDGSAHGPNPLCAETSEEQLKKIKLQALRLGDCLVSVTHSVRNLGVQFDAKMTVE